MTYARKLKLTDDITFELGKPLKYNGKRSKGKITTIKITYPIARVFVVGKDKPVETVFLQRGSEIEWVDGDD